MPSIVPDYDARRFQGTLPPRPAVFEPPPQVREALAREEERIHKAHGQGISPEARKRILDEWTLNYYCWNLDGVDIAYRAAERGVEVLGLGFEEVMNVRRTYGDGPETDITYRQI
jgi:hypothetical protein